MAPSVFAAEVDDAPSAGRLLFVPLSIAFSVAIILSSPLSKPNSLSVLGESRSAVGMPLSRDRMLFERVTPFPEGEMKEFDRDNTPMFLERSAKTEFELPLRRNVGGLDALGAASSLGTRSNARRFDMLPPLSPSVTGFGGCAAECIGIDIFGRTGCPTDAEVLVAPADDGG